MKWSRFLGELSLRPILGQFVELPLSQLGLAPDSRRGGLIRRFHAVKHGGNTRLNPRRPRQRVGQNLT